MWGIYVYMKFELYRKNRRETKSFPSTDFPYFVSAEIVTFWYRL